MSFYKSKNLNVKWRAFGFGNLVIPALAASFVTQLSISKTCDICECGDLCPPLFSFAPITRPWQLRKMRVNPSKLVGDIEWPGAGLWHLCSLKPDNLIWRQRFSKLSHGSVVSQCLGLFIPPPFFFLLALMVSVDWGRGRGGCRESSKPDQHQQTKKWLLGINESVVSSGWDWMFHDGLLVLKGTISHNICRGHNIPLASHSAGMSLH